MIFGRPICLTVAWLLASCGNPAEHSLCSSTVQALYGADASVVDQRVSASVGVVAFVLPNQQVQAVCTATSVAPDWLLTARHCIPKASEWSLFASFENRVSKASLYAPGTASCDPHGLERYDVQRVEAHTTFDLVLLRVVESTHPWLASTTQAPVIGEAVTMVGYGLQESGAIGIQETLPATVTGLDDGLIEVRAKNGGACVGDSGGPLLRATVDGPKLLGVLSRGSGDCITYDRYVSIAEVWYWLDVTIAATAD